MTTCTTPAAECWAHILAQPDGYPMGVAADWLQDHADHDGSPEAKAEACAAVEAVAQQHLDARPDDHRARRLLGEWLQWHRDVRGEGLRALGACGRESRRMFSGGAACYLWYDLTDQMTECELNHIQYPQEAVHAASDLPFGWFRELRDAVEASEEFKEYHTRRAAEDAAALAFNRLPAERRAALLKGEM